MADCKKFVMERTGLMITLRCNLKCILCAAYAPYIKEKEDFSFSMLKETINRYFSVVDYVEKFTITGGEPLLHTKLDDILLEVIKYKDSIGTLEIITNGTIVPSDSLMDIVVKCPKVKFLVDKYGKLSKSISEIEKKFMLYNFLNYSIRENSIDNPYCDGWVDFGNYELKWTEDEAKSLFSKCIQPQKFHFCFAITNGKMHPCGKSKRCKDLGIISGEDEYVDLLDRSLSSADIQKRIEMIQKADVLEACRYCNGFCEDSLRYPPAEQMRPGVTYELR